MFSSKAEAVKVLECAYRKLKAYYYKNKNLLPVKKKIVDFEYDSKSMTATLKKIADVLRHPKKVETINYLESLYKEIDVYVLPKKFESVETNSDKPVTNEILENKNLKTVNFFINAPIELMLLDVVWSMFLSKEMLDENVLSGDVYANCVRYDAVNPSGGFESNRFFYHYFNQYNQWRNGAFRSLEDNYENHQNSVLISLDLKSYYYSVRFSFASLRKHLSQQILRKLKNLSLIQEKIYLRYKEILSLYNRDIKGFNSNEYPLPLGLFSSMILANLYLTDFDKDVRSLNAISYYGRYVDDMLFVFNDTVQKSEKNEDVIDRLLVKTGVLKSKRDGYFLQKIPNLNIQNGKIKIISIDCQESKAIIDTYNKTFRLIPSEINPLPDYEMKLTSFEEETFDIKSLSVKDKIRDIGQINVDSFEIGRFFSSLLTNYSRVNFSEDKISGKNNIEENISGNVEQINRFFSGFRCIEYYHLWIKYLYFLVIVNRWDDIKNFFLYVKRHLDDLSFDYLKKEYKRGKSVSLKLKETLQDCLNVGFYSALSLNVELISKVRTYNKTQTKLWVDKFIAANYFDDSLIPIPLSNYFNYSNDVSYLTMKISDLGKLYGNWQKNKKLKWSPRFIQYDEISLLLFFSQHRRGIRSGKAAYASSESYEFYRAVNYLKKDNAHVEVKDGNRNNLNAKYNLRRFIIPGYHDVRKVYIGVASLKYEPNALNAKKRSFEYKQTLNKILQDMYSFCQKNMCNILIMPEACIPIYWLKDFIRFSKLTQIAIIAGLQHIDGKNDRVCNYLFSSFPYMHKNPKVFKETFIHIREKNDYAPDEKVMFSEVGKRCIDAVPKEYATFYWRGMYVAPLVCFELTDIRARALLKGRCDLLTASVYNHDTTYFSNIISSSARDLQCIVAQSNTSLFGDCRITGPYDRNHKEVVQLKGGANDNVIIGEVNIAEMKKGRKQYYKDKNYEIESNIARFKSGKRLTGKEKKIDKAELKPLSAGWFVRKK